MCLYNDYEIAKKLANSSKKELAGYKIIVREHLKEQFAYHSLHQSWYRWKNGINKAGTQYSAGELPVTYSEIHYGIHIFRTLKEARANLYNPYKNRIIIKVYGSPKDLIGANEKQMVFTKVRWERPKERPSPKKR